MIGFCGGSTGRLLASHGEIARPEFRMDDARASALPHCVSPMSISTDPGPNPLRHDAASGGLQRSLWHDAWRRLRQNRLALSGGAIVLLLAFVTCAAPWLAPHDPNVQYLERITGTSQPMAGNAQFPLGTDYLGRDLLSRLIWGARISFVIGVSSNVIAVVLAVIVGATAGYAGGWIETCLMRVTDVFMAFPTLLLAVGLVAVLRPSIASLILSIGLAGWTYLARIVYGEVSSIRARDFVLAARAVGVPPRLILVRHVLPHLVSILTVYGTLRIGSTVMLEAMLSYIGIGIQPPTASWGSMICEGQYYYRAAPWLVLYPGAVIALTVLGFNLLGDGLRDALDPRQRH